MPADQALLLASLKQHEGCRLTPYKDTKGIWTVGYGHNCQAAPISQAVADQLLADDVAAVQAAVEARWPWSAQLDPVRGAVFVELAYNLGVGGLAQFPVFLAAAERGDVPAACAALMNSQWFGQVKVRGVVLVERWRTGTP